MGAEYKVVIENLDLLSKICGVNDSNLKLIEHKLNVPVYTRGNEIYIETDNETIRQNFSFIIDRIVDEFEDGCSDFEAAVCSVLNVKLHADISASAIIIPGAEKRIYPKTQNQADYIQCLRKYDMVFCTGPAGCGKSFLAVAEALRLVLSKQKSSIILTRPVVEAGESLGYLPGDLEQKISPYLRPLYDAMESVVSKETVKRLLENGIIESAPLAYMRGRTLNNSVIILDEAQNSTCEQMKMFLTRMGALSKVFVTGDLTQIDLPKKVPSGLTHAVSVLSGITEIGMMKLDGSDVIRNPLVKKIVKAYENEQNFR